MPSSRRRFLGESIFVLAGATAGTIALTGCTGPSVLTVPPPHQSPLGRFSAGLGWTVKGLGDDSAFAYLQVGRPLTLAGVHIDASFLPSLTDGAAGSTQALCQAWVSRGAPPAFPQSGGAASPTSNSADFGTISIYNPAGLTVHAEDAPQQDVFYRALLRSQVPTSGIDSVATAAAYCQPALVLKAGDYVAFGIEQSGVSGDLQLQVSLDYE